MTALMDVLQGAIDIDTNIFLFINGMHNTFFDYFMSAYSGKWVWVPMYAAIWYVMLRNSLESDFVLHGRSGTRNYHCRPDGGNIDTPVCGTPSSRQSGKSHIRHGAYRKRTSRRALWIPLLSCCQYFWSGILCLVSFP